MVSLKNKAYNYVFIVGCPRSGKTLLQKILAFNGNFAWFSQYYSLFRNFSAIGILNRIYDLPILGNLLSSLNEKIILPHPVEMPKDYNKKLKGISSLEEDDVTDMDRQKIKNIFEKQLKYQNKMIFLTDEGRPARMLYFKKIFPQSKFIHVIRDGRNVVASLLKDCPHWFNEDLDLYSFYKSVPDNFNRSLLKYRGTENYILALTALRWKMAIFELERQRKKLNNHDYLVVKYEELVENKTNTINKILIFLGLNYTNKLKMVVKNKNLYQNKNLWKLYFNSEQKKIINSLLEDFLSKYKYDFP